MRKNRYTTYCVVERAVYKVNSMAAMVAFPQAELQSVYFYHTDHLGSAQTITNWRGELHERLEYTPYGELWIDWRAPSALHTTPFRFTGMEHDRETGLIYFGARYLDPRMSRWLSTDPAMWQGYEGLIGLGGVFNHFNLHVFHYSFNNPIRYYDPDGRAVPLIIVGAAKIIKMGAVGAGTSVAVDVGLQGFTNLMEGDYFFDGLDAIDIGVSAAFGAVTGVTGTGLLAQGRRAFNAARDISRARPALQARNRAISEGRVRNPVKTERLSAQVRESRREIRNAICIVTGVKVAEYGVGLIDLSGRRTGNDGAQPSGLYPVRYTQLSGVP